MTHKLLFRLPGRTALRRTVLSLLVALLAAVGFTSPSLAQEPVFSNDGMRWEGYAAGDATAAESGLDQDQAVLALDAARNLDEHSQLILPEPDADEVAQRMVPTDDADRQLQQTGFTREVVGFEQLAPSPAGMRRGSDGQDYSVSQRLVGSKGAISIRLHFSGVHLPPGARLYVYGMADDGVQQKGYDSAWLGDRTSFWSHTIPGDSAVVEYHPPPPHLTAHDGADRAASYTVDQVVHNVVDTFSDTFNDTSSDTFNDTSSDGGATISANAAACHLDMCDNPAWREVGNGVVRLLFMSGSRSYVCSGALLNNKANNGIPYIYTAAHCIWTESEASTAELWYFWQRNSCSDNPGSNRVTRLGATLLTTSVAGYDNSDFTLLRASRTPPNGVMFLGWTTANIAVGTAVTGIHHPQGDFKRINFGNKTEDGLNLHRVVWTGGISESGSSGSPLIINGPDGSSAKVIGNLQSARSARCNTPQSPYSYGTFSRAWSSFAPFLNADPLPDLIVDSVSVTNAAPLSDTPFMINVVAKNGGTTTAAATKLLYYRSADSTITAADTQLATGDVSRLAPNGSSQQNASVSITDPGRHWVGACINAVSGEAATANNCSAGVRITVTSSFPDLIVDNILVTSGPHESGAAFNVNATVRNTGNRAATATTLRFYSSADDTITTDDSELATDPVDGLRSGWSSHQNATVAIANTGDYWVGACVDEVASEVATDNNCSGGVQVTITAPPVTVPTLPDLTVDNVRVSDTSVQTGVSFTINATARNSGNGASTATTLRYYRSADDTITTDDSELATDPVSALAADASSQQNATVSFAHTGSYWVGACVNEVVGEVATDNNCSVGVQVTVTAPPGVVPTRRPDLTVDNVRVSDTSVQTGVSFTINATVRNSGNGVAPATTLRYYRSTDRTITTDDSELTTDPVGMLTANATSPESAAVSILNTGNYWVGVCVDTVADEVARTNNCSTGVPVSVTAPPAVVPTRRPDLTVDGVSVSDRTPAPGASFTLNATVRNSGNGASAATTLRYYRSTNNTITRSDTTLATDPVRVLAANATSPESATVSIPNTGNWWVGACVNTVNSETAINNNCSTGVQVSVTAPPVTVPSRRPDLTVDGVSVSDTTPAPGASFTINATVRNSGGGVTAATTLRYYRSTDRTITTDDSELTTDPVGVLSANATSPESATVSIPNTGNWWVGACVNTVNSETAINNNCSTGVQVSVTAPPVTVPSRRPDLTVDGVSVSDTTPAPGASFTINATVRNSGGGVTAATTLRYYRSTDRTITRSDTTLATDPVGVLSANATSPESATVSIPNTGDYWVGACVDAGASELARTNNCSTGVQVTVTAPPVVVPTLPDLTVDTVSVSDATPEAGVSFTINATARNSGNGVAPATTLRYYRSTDSTITTDDSELTTDTVSALVAGGSSQENAAVSIADAGNYWVGACADTVNSEVAINNNCSVGVPVEVVGLPDLIVDSVSVSESTVEVGVSFTVNATARNSGEGVAPATTLHYYRSADDTITADDSELATDPISALAADGSSPESSVVSIADAGNYWIGACIDTVNGEVAINNNCSSGVQINVMAPPDNGGGALPAIIQLLLAP